MKKKKKERHDRYYLTKTSPKSPRFRVVGKIVKLGEFETFQVEESQLRGGWYSVIRKLGSIPRSTVNGLLGTRAGQFQEPEGRACCALALGPDSGQSLAR